MVSLTAQKRERKKAIETDQILFSCFATSKLLFNYINKVSLTTLQKYGIYLRQRQQKITKITH